MTKNIAELIEYFPQRQLALLGRQFREEDRSAEGFPSRERLSTGELMTHEWINVCYCWSFLDDTERISIIPYLAKIWATEVFVEDSQFPTAYYTFLYRTQIVDCALSSSQRNILWEHTRVVFDTFAKMSFERYLTYTEYANRWICTFNSISIIWGEMGRYTRERWMLKDSFSCSFVLKYYQGLFEGLEINGMSQDKPDPVSANNFVAMTNTCHFDYDHLHFPVQSQKALSRIVQIQKVQSALVKLTNRLDSERELAAAMDLKYCCERYQHLFSLRCYVMDYVYKTNSIFGIPLTWAELISMTPDKDSRA